MKKALQLLGLFFILSSGINAQKLSFSGQLGWAKPLGTAFQDANGNDMASGGIGYELDAVYHFEKFESRLGVGLVYNGSALLGISTGNTLDIGLYGLELFGAKTIFRPFTGVFSPYGALSIGVGRMSTPEITSGNVVITPATYAYSFGLKPEIGLDIGGFLIAAHLTTPFGYKFEAATESFTAGSIQINIGYRQSFDL